MPPSIYTSGTDVYDEDIRKSYEKDVNNLTRDDLVAKYGRPPYPWLSDVSVKGKSAYPYRDAKGILYRFDSPSSIRYRLPITRSTRTRKEMRYAEPPTLPYYDAGERVTFGNDTESFDIRVTGQNSALTLSGTLKKENRVTCTIIKKTPM